MVVSGEVSVVGVEVALGVCGHIEFHRSIESMHVGVA